MDFYELKAFILLARHLHFAKAATVLHASPSALSRILSRLEEEVGTRLVDRETRQIRLTEAGAQFLVFAQESLDKKDGLHLLLGSTDGILRGNLRVFASVTACYSILPALADTLKNLHPELKLTVETGDPAEAEVFLRENKVDLALAALPDQGFSGLESFSVRRTPLVFAASREGIYGNLDLGKLKIPGDPLVSRNLWMQTLGTHPLILPSRGLARERLDRWASSHHVHLKIAAETSGNEAVLALARLGLGLGLVPRIVLENSPFSDGLTLYPAGEELGDYDLGFILPKESASLGKKLQDALRELLVMAYPGGSWV